MNKIYKSKIILFFISTIFILFDYSCIYASSDKETNNNDTELREVLSKVDKNIASIKTLHCDFIQKKYLDIMKQPMVISGEIFIKAPDKFAWHGKEPVKYSLIIKGNTLRQWSEDSNKINVINAEDNPVFQVVVSQMKGWFSGNYSKQKENYKIKVNNRKPLILNFEPRKNSKISNYIKSVEITFKKKLSYISSVKVVDIDEEKMVMKFKNLKKNCKLPSDAWSIKK